MRDRLIELVKNAHDEQNYLTSDKSINAIADYLLENGVIVPLCKVEDKVYKVGCSNCDYLCGITGLGCDDCPYENRKVMEGTVLAVKFVKGIRLKVRFDTFTDDFCEDELYYTREEAEAKLKEGGKE